MKSFYLTTPIYYVNDRPHIGHAYTTFAADAICTWHRMRGDDVVFLTGTDENAQKNVEAAAAKLGIEKHAISRAQVQAYVDEMSALWQRTWDSLSVRYDIFMRTTADAHVRGVVQLIEAVRAKGDISTGTYAGWYCVGCEAFIPEKELEGGMCPTHVRAVERVEEENYFFKLSRYRDELLRHFDAHPHFVQPESRRNEILAYIRDHLEDISISRPMRSWGIPFPGDPSQAVYVWFDALGNYLTATGYGTGNSRDSSVSQWPADVHLIGKDILKFHAALWPAMLMSAGLPLPERIFAHGFFTIDGKKMSKSIGNVVDPVRIAERYGTDAIRYFLLKEIPFGGDGDFSEERLRERYGADLQHGIGNLVARTFAMVEQYAGGVVPAAGASRLGDAWERYEHAMLQLLPHEALAVVEEIVRSSDRFIEEQKPWALAKDVSQRARLMDVLGTLSETIRNLALMLTPFLPDASGKILSAFGQQAWRTQSLDELRRWGGILNGVKLQKLDHLFPSL